jgi:hypothetical protein
MLEANLTETARVVAAAFVSREAVNATDEDCCSAPPPQPSPSRSRAHHEVTSRPRPLRLADAAAVTPP